MKKLLITLLILNASQIYSRCGCSAPVSTPRPAPTTVVRSNTGSTVITPSVNNTPRPVNLPDSGQILRHLVLFQSLVAKANLRGIPANLGRTVRQQKELVRKINVPLLIKRLKDTQLAK